ncbi:MAG TPA: hypothetical protein VFQ43_00695 [Nitrososphaera sp.]|nr:hypothetical protein [Nitrososphaera sp.]
MFDGNPMPPCPECTRAPGPIESFLGLLLVFWILFFLIVWLLPDKWSDPIWKIAFPFMPRKDGPGGEV